MCDFLTVEMCALRDWLKDWQTLTAGIIALAGAGWTVRTISRQIKIQEKQHSNILKNKAWSAQAHLPDALLSLTGYIKEATRSLLGEAKKSPRPPIEAMAELKMIIEHVEPKSAERIFKIIINYQVQNARLGCFLDGGKKKVEIPEHLYDLALLQALVNSLVGFAHGEQETGPDAEITQDKVVDALKNIKSGISYDADIEDELGKVEEIIKRHHH